MVLTSAHCIAVVLSHDESERVCCVSVQLVLCKSQTSDTLTVRKFARTTVYVKDSAKQRLRSTPCDFTTLHWVINVSTSETEQRQDDRSIPEARQRRWQERCRSC